VKDKPKAKPTSPLTPTLPEGRGEKSGISPSSREGKKKGNLLKGRGVTSSVPGRCPFSPPGSTRRKRLRCAKAGMKGEVIRDAKKRAGYKPAP